MTETALAVVGLVSLGAFMIAVSAHFCLDRATTPKPVSVPAEDAGVEPYTLEDVATWLNEEAAQAERISKRNLAQERAGFPPVTESLSARTYAREASMLRCAARLVRQAAQNDSTLNAAPAAHAPGPGAEE